MVCLSVVASCGDKDGDTCSVAPPSIIAQPAPNLYWIAGAPVPKTPVEIQPHSSECLRLSISDEDDPANPIAVQLETDGGDSHVALPVSSLSSGRYTLLIEARWGDASEPFYEIPFEANLLHPAQGSAQYALVIGIDGLRGDAADMANTPNLHALANAGAYRWDASTHLTAQTMSGPGWASILTGVDSEKHRVTANNEFPIRDQDYPSFLKRIRDLTDHSTAATIHWPPILLQWLDDENALDESVLGSDEEITEATVKMIQEGNHNAIFIALDDVDHAGHATSFGSGDPLDVSQLDLIGFMPGNPDYMAAIEVADAQVGRLLTAIFDRPTLGQENWLIAVTSDHGGNWSGHGLRTEEFRNIPLIFAGQRVTPGEIEGEFVSHMDLHPTLLSYFGLEIDPGWKIDGEVRALQ